jgi:Protein of unknown function (DUF3631)
MSLIKRDVNPFDQLLDIIVRHVDADPHYLVGIALWALHTHIFHQYAKTPRLAILSPVHNCGKSTVLDILSAMVWNPKKTADPTVATLFRLANDHTLLLDEVDNMSIIRNMRSILNDGHSKGGSVTRTGKDGEVISYPVYGPVALAGIGRLPATLMSRSIIVRIHRSAKVLERFKISEQYYAPQLAKWAKQVNLNQNPKMPSVLTGRDADKWRPLIAIADSFNRGVMARRMALNFLKESDNPDIKESLLRDTQKVFNTLKTSILTTDILCQKLREDKEGEYEIDYVEYKVTKRVIGNLLSEFQLRSKPHRYGANVKRCWFRADFEAMWKKYAE